MLSKFQAMNKANAHPALPQSESFSKTDDGVHRGYTRVLEKLSIKAGTVPSLDSLVVHVLIPTLPTRVAIVKTLCIAKTISNIPSAHES